MTTRRIGILGGTFDPIHCGHIDLGHAAGQALGLTSLFVITSNIPPHRPQPVASGYHRFAMTTMAVAGVEEWRASDFELQAGAQSFTIDTLVRFHAEGYQPSELFFVVGTDAFLDIESWKDYPVLLDQAHFVVVSRPGFPVDVLAGRLPSLARRMRRAPFESATDGPSIFLIEAPTTDASSTAIRHRLAAGESIAGLVPPPVQRHIEQHGLYAAATAHPGGFDRLLTQAPGRLHGQD
jgi:nicotinate-nucleotide adenylyltransferase